MKILVCALALLPTIGFALPVKHGKVTVPHTIVTLNESQLEEIETFDTVTLTSDQWRRARKTMPEIRKRIVGVLPANWEDSTGGTLYQAILLPDDNLAVIHGLTIDLKGFGDGSEPIRLGSAGQFYVSGRAYDFDSLIGLIRRSPDVSERRINRGERLRIAVSPPPGKKPTDADIYERVKNVYEELSRKGWNGGSVPDHIEKP